MQMVVESIKQLSRPKHNALVEIAIVQLLPRPGVVRSNLFVQLHGLSVRCLRFARLPLKSQHPAFFVVSTSFLWIKARVFRMAENCEGLVETFSRWVILMSNHVLIEPD